MYINLVHSSIQKEAQFSDFDTNPHIRQTPFKRLPLSSFARVPPKSTQSNCHSPFHVAILLKRSYFLKKKKFHRINPASPDAPFHEPSFRNQHILEINVESARRAPKSFEAAKLLFSSTNQDRILCLGSTLT
jgi:hypothetical protein